MMDHTRRAYETASALLVSIVAIIGPVPRPSSEAVCPGNARGIDCRVWPPPIKDDPDRLISGSAGA
jgi:hypothetical protein